MKAKDAIDMYGSLDELVNVISKIAEDNGLRIYTEPHVNDENPDDINWNFLNIVFVVPYDCDSWGKNFPKAREKVNLELLPHNLQLTYECSGDGDGGTIMSYRVSRF